MERGISPEHVREAIRNPSLRKTDKYGMITVQKIVNGKLLEVIFKIQKSKFIIITAYYEN